MDNLRLTHKEIPIQEIPGAARELREFVATNSLIDYVVLQTCNRAELFYLDGKCKCKPLPGFVWERGFEAWRHLMRVACGLESLVIGETEILHQVKKALAQAQTEGHCSDELAKYFVEAIRAGREARSLTKISAGKVSVVSLALEHITGMLGDLSGKKILVVGAGDIGTKVARGLKNLDVEKILVSSRNYFKAVKLAREIGGAAHSFSQLKDLIGGVDCVFCATSAPHPIITKETFAASKNGIVLVDLSVPRNVGESVKELENVKLLSLEHFTAEVKKNREKRAMETKKVEELIERRLEKMRSDLRGVPEKR